MTYGSRSMHRAAFAVLVALTATIPTTPAEAQVRASERGGVWQTVDGTTIRVAYGRPGARGRDLFGGVVHWGEVWTPGANWATTLEVDHEVRINDTSVPAGEYSVWLIAKQDEWTLNLHAETGRFHTQRPDPSTFAVTIPVTPGEGDYSERLTFEFAEFSRNRTTLTIRWGDTVVPLDIRVRATMARAPLSPDVMAPYLGTYATKIYGGGPPATFDLELVDISGRIRARGAEGEFFELIVTDEPHVFHMGMLRDGEIFDVEHVLLTFTMVDGVAASFVVPGQGIPIWIEGERK